MPTLIAIDGNSLLFRAFHALPILTDAKGRYTNAVYGFMGMLIRLIQEEKPDYLAVAFDLKAPTFRHLQYKDYKAGRKETPEELIPQFDLLKETLGELGIAVLSCEGYEADDILGAMGELAKQNHCQALLVTGDKDALQLVGGPVKVLYTKRGISDTDLMDAEAVKQKMGVYPELVADLKGLMGDSSDNIPGVPGVGPKTAAKLLDKFGTLEEVLAHADEAGGPKLRQSLATYAEQARQSKFLATIDPKVPCDFQLEKIAFEGIHEPVWGPVLADLGFSTLAKRLGISSASSKEETPAAAMPDITIQRLESLADWRKAVSACPQTVALYEDKEGLHMAVSETEEVYVAFSQTLLGDGVDPYAALEMLAPVMADASVEKILYDAKSWAHTMRQWEVEIRGRCQDVMLAAYVENPAQGQKDVQTLCQTHGLLAPDQAANACTMLQLYRNMEAGLQQWRGFEVYQTLELPLWRVLFDMECTGFRLDLAQLHDLAQQYATRIKELEKEIYDLAGEQFNINSTKQLGEVLFDKLRLPAWKKTKTGYSTDVEVLEQLKEQHPIIACILEYRKATKLKSTYLDGLQAVSDQSNGRVHTRFHQNITLTGRISSSEPNLQNIPVRTEEGREIRRAFIPSDEDRCLVVADYSQIELRILAHMAKEDTMIDTFRHGGDIHTATAAKVYGVDQESVTKDMRSSAKAVNFGIVYGISDFGLSRNLSIPRKQAAALIQSYFETYPKIRGYMDQCVADGRAHGYVETMYGRRRYTPELASKNYNVRSFGERAAMNAPIQGTAADIIKAAMIHVHETLKKECPQAKLILQVHDELIVDVPRDQAEKVKKILTDCMQNVLPLDVPLIAEADSGENWLEAK